MAEGDLEPSHVPSCEEVEHSSDAEHDSGRDGIPLEPESDEGGCDENNVGDEDGGEVKSPISIEDQLYLQTTVVPCDTVRRSKYRMSGSFREYYRKYGQGYNIIVVNTT